MTSSKQPDVAAAISEMWTSMRTYIDSVNWHDAALQAAATPPRAIRMRHLSQVGVVVRSLFDVPIEAVPAMVRGHARLRLDADVARRCGVLPTIGIEMIDQISVGVPASNTTILLLATPDLDIADPASDLVAVVDAEEFSLHYFPPQEPRSLKVTIDPHLSVLYLAEVERR